MNIGQILKAKGRAVATARPDATLLEIVAKLTQKKIGAIVVVGDNGHVAGIISERDVIRAVSERGSAALSLSVSEFMTKSVVSCQETSAIDELMEQPMLASVLDSGLAAFDISCNGVGDLS